MAQITSATFKPPLIKKIKGVDWKVFRSRAQKLIEFKYGDIKASEGVVILMKLENDVRRGYYNLNYLQADERIKIINETLAKTYGVKFN